MVRLFIFFDVFGIFEKQAIIDCEYEYQSCIHIFISHLLFPLPRVCSDKALINIPVDNLIDYLAQRSRGRW